MEKIIMELMGIKEDYNTRVEDEVYSYLDEYKYRDLTAKEIERINELRRNIFYLYKGIENLDKIKEEN